MDTPRYYFLRSIRTALIEMFERVWNLEREMTGWGPGKRPDLLFDDLDSEEERMSRKIAEVDDAICFKSGN